MRCPYCGELIASLWQYLYRVTEANGMALDHPDATLPSRDFDRTYIRWMLCHNPQCQQLIVEVWRGSPESSYVLPQDDWVADASWFAIPRRTAPRQINNLVPDDFKRDYAEASLILEDSPRMSSVLSRRILAELLKQYAKRDEYGLAKQIDEFVKEASHPEELRRNLHILREMGDFGAHTKRDQQDDQIIDVDPEEAEWTLDIVDSLFDYFIVGPSRNAERRTAFEQKMQQAGRKPIKPLPEDENGA